MGKRRARTGNTDPIAQELDPRDPARILTAAEQNIGPRRRGFAGRVHLTPLDIYRAGEMYQDDDFRREYKSLPDAPRAIWSSRDDDVGMYTDMFCYRHGSNVYTQSRKEWKLLDTAGGTLPAPPGGKKLTQPFGLYKGWKIYNRLNRLPMLYSDAYEDGERNPLLLVFAQNAQGNLRIFDDNMPKWRNYWEMLKEVFTELGRMGKKVWVLGIGVEKLEEPEEDFKKPHCWGFAIDNRTHTLELTEGADALEMLAAALRVAGYGRGKAGKAKKPGKNPR